MATASLAAAGQGVGLAFDPVAEADLDLRGVKDWPPELVLECRAAAGENWLDYCSALEPL